MVGEQSSEANQTKLVEDLFFVNKNKNNKTNKQKKLGEDFFLSSSKFETQIHVVKTSATLDQNYLLNPVLKVKHFPNSVIEQLYTIVCSKVCDKVW